MLAYGVEAGTQTTLDRLKEADACPGGARRRRGEEARDRAVHGFFVIGCPGETAEDIQDLRFAARLELDTFGFNRLAVYRDAALERVRRQGSSTTTGTGTRRSSAAPLIPIPSRMTR